jgi:hypothetical protein
MLGDKSFNIEFEGREIMITQTNGPHGNKSRHFGRIYMHPEKDCLRAHRGFVFEEDDAEEVVVGEFSGTFAFKKAMEAIMNAYEDIGLDNFS